MMVPTESTVPLVIEKLNGKMFMGRQLRFDTLDRSCMSIIEVTQIRRVEISLMDGNTVEGDSRIVGGTHPAVHVSFFTDNNVRTTQQYFILFDLTLLH